MQPWSIILTLTYNKGEGSLCCGLYTGLSPLHRPWLPALIVPSSRSKGRLHIIFRLRKFEKFNWDITIQDHQNEKERLYNTISNASEVPAFFKFEMILQFNGWSWHQSQVDMMDYGTWLLIFFKTKVYGLFITTPPNKVVH